MHVIASRESQVSSVEGAAGIGSLKIGSVELGIDSVSFIGFWCVFRSCYVFVLPLVFETVIDGFPSVR